MKCNVFSQLFTPDFSHWPINSPERFIHGYWQLNMMRFHAFSHECGDELWETCRRINHELGAQTTFIDLLCLGDDYRKKSHIMNVIRDNEQPTWVWFINCEALLDTSLAGWLRSILTTYDTDHVRVTFLLDSQEQYRNIFQRYSAPLYKSTIAFDLKKS